VPVVTAADHLPSTFDSLDGSVPTEIRRSAYQIVSDAQQSPHANRTPSGTAAAAVYLAVGQYGEWSQAEIADAAGVAAVTVRNGRNTLTGAPDVDTDVEG
jgi:transcription initiation factor TFIIIB Brf1 subunit/transcription initiation factor TFIIB